MYADQPGPRFSWAMQMKCPMCGHKPITKGYGELLLNCPGCGYEYEQGEDGYWAGALIMNMAMVLISFFVTFGLLLLSTWPDVPWDLVSIVAVIAMVIVPTWFYPRSKTVWVWLDNRIHPYTEQERPLKNGPSKQDPSTKNQE